MKRYISLLLAAVMALTMTACGGRSDTDTEGIGGTVRPGVTENTGTGTVQPGTDDETQDGFEPGSVSGGVYANEFAGIGCKLDDSWVFYTQEQMAELNGVLTEGTDSEDVKAMLADSPSIFDMYAVSTDGLMTMNVVFQNMGLLLGTTMSAQEYAELHVTQIPDAMEAYGFEDVTASVTTAELAGEERPAIALTATIQDIPVYELIVCLRQGNYIYCVTLCSYTEDVTAQMAELFYAL